MKYQKMYFMGVKGVGMAPLAIIAAEAGLGVAGSDLAEIFITDEALHEKGIKIYKGFDSQNIADFIGKTSLVNVLFVATAAHDGFDNVEAVFARESGIKVISHGEAVGLFMEGSLFDREFYGISVAGSHGKTTVSGFLAAALVALSADPTYAVGTSKILGIGPSGHFGSGKYFVAEADEYLSEKNIDRRAKLLHHLPKSAIINNIDFDHPDFYHDIEDVKKVFYEFCTLIPEEGYLIVNGDDENTMDVLNRPGIQGKIIRFGTGSSNDFILSNYHEKGFGGEFDVVGHGTEFGRFTINVPGFHNAKNALSVIALLTELGFSPINIIEALKNFKGVARRLEIVGKTRHGQILIDDYAHHPEEIRKSIDAIRHAFPDMRLCLIFQPHTYSRTKSLENEFVAALALSDELIVLSTFASARKDEDNDNYDEKFMALLERLNKNALYIKDIDSVVKYLDKNLTEKECIIATFGAGDVYKIAYKLKS